MVDKRTISVDSKVWEQAREIIKGELNLTMSKYIEIQLRSLVRSTTQTQRELYENIALDLIEASERKKRASSSPNKGGGRKVRGRPKEE